MISVPFSLPPPNSPAGRLFITVTTWLAVALFALSALFASANLRGLQSGNTLTDQVNALQLASERLLSSLKDAETGQRGYLLTGNPTYLEPYDAARARLDADFARLEAAPLATPDQTRQIGRIRELAVAKLAELGRTITLYQAGHHEAALQLDRTNRSKNTMDAIRAEVNALQSATAARVMQANASIYSAWGWSKVVGLDALACVLVSGVIWIKRRAQIDTNARFYRLERFTRAFGLAQGTLRGLDGRILFWDVGAEHLYGYTPQEALGRIGHDLLRTEFPQHRGEIEVALLRDGAWQGELLCRHRDGRQLYVISRWALSRGEAGEPDVAIEISSDITAIKVAEQERQRAMTLLRTIVETAPGLIYAKDRQGRMTLANASALNLIGKPWALVEGRTDLEFLDDPVQAEQVVANDQRIMEQGQTEELEEMVGGDGHQPRVWFSSKAPLRDDRGAVIGLVGVSVEITERKRIEDRLHLMVNELNHRVKNTLTTVQSIAAQTLRGGDPTVRMALEGRLVALAAAHDVLTRENWEGASLGDVVAGALAPFGGRESGQFKVSGPVLRLLPRAALALSMGLHELTTNAVKYGALSSASGQVEIRWEITGGAEPVFRLLWTERGGPPVSAPARRGFGIRLIERSLAQDLGGTAVVMFDDPEGITGLVESPLADVVALAEVLPLLRVGGVRGNH